VKLFAVLVILTLTGCSSLRLPDDVGVSIEDLEGVGNPNIDECQITFGGELPAVPCVIQINFEWEV